MLNTISVLLLKFGLLFLALPILLADLLLIQTSLPRLSFVSEPFVHTAIFVIAIGAIVSLATKSRVYVLWVIACLFFSGIFFTHHVTGLFLDQFSVCTLVMAALFVVGAISFLYRNKFTGPLLVLLPICSGAWVFWSVIYNPYFVAWFSRVRNHMSIEASFHEVLRNWPTHLETLAIGVIPMMVIYVFANRSYEHYSLYWKIHSRKQEED
jgi:hypothetical protein